MVSAMQWICVLWFEVLLMGNYGWPHLLAMGVNCWAIALADAIRPHALLWWDNGGRMCYMEWMEKRATFSVKNVLSVNFLA
jgi:hypothetical protein